MAAFCSRDSLRSSDLENLVCTLSSAEDVENPPIMKDHYRSRDNEAIHSKVSGYRTALHRSAMVGNSETMAALIAGGCAVDLQDPLGNTALHEVSWHGFTQCVKLLVKAGADVHVKNKAGNTALHLACQNAHAPTAQLLLLGGSNPDAKNKVGDTCLHVAARYNNLNLMKILLRSRCCLKETNQVGDTALHVTAALNHRKAVQFLLSAGIDVRVRNKAGKTALDKAREHQSKQVALLLSKVPQVRYMRRKTMKKPRLRAPTRPTKDGTCEMKQTEPRSGDKDLDEEDLTSGRKHKVQKDEFWDEGGKTFQLYSLYRDREGRVRKAPASSCLSESFLKKLQDNLMTTKEELRLQILNIQEELHSQMDRMERHNKHQLRKLDVLIQEKAASERRSITSRMEQRAAQDRAETLRNQQKQTWSRLPLLFSGDSSPSGSTNTLRPRCFESLRLAEPTGNRTYFEMKVDRCAEQNPESFPTVSAAPCWHPAVLQNLPHSADDNKEPSSSTSTGPQEEAWGPMKDTMVLEFLMDRPAEPTFIQERKHLHAIEVTQQFFDAVSAQLERWCSRKILEVELQSELRARAERKEMLQRIRELEEELHRLQTNEGKEKQKKSDC
ncbi:uncharacterized protein FYW61_014230 [Anableps anableps]